MPSGSSSLVELTIETLRTGPYRSNTAHTLWGHTDPEVRDQWRTSTPLPGPVLVLGLPWQCRWLQAPYPLHLPGRASCHLPLGECPHGSPPRAKVRQGQVLSPPLPATPTPTPTPVPEVSCFTLMRSLFPCLQSFPGLAQELWNKRVAAWNPDWTTYLPL